MRHGWFQLIGLAVACVASAPGHARLVSQSVQGVRRTCVYEGARLQLATPRAPATRLRYVVVGRGEPCPASAGRELQPAQPTPSMATLRTEFREGNAKICVYTYLGRDYRRPVGAMSPCPMTPNF